MKTIYAKELINAIVECDEKGGKVLICGNGGLAAASEHFSAELVGKFGFDIYIPCFALTANSSLVTALANDFGYEEVFAHQVKAIGKMNDVLVAMTTSASTNIQRVIEAANAYGLITVAICGQQSPDLHAQQTYRMKSEHVAAIQDEIMEFLHYIAYNCKRQKRKLA